MEHSDVTHLDHGRYLIFRLCARTTLCVQLSRPASHFRDPNVLHRSTHDFQPSKRTALALTLLTVASTLAAVASLGVPQGKIHTGGIKASKLPPGR